MKRITGSILILGLVLGLFRGAAAAEETKPLLEVFSDGDMRRLTGLLEKFLEEDPSSPRKLDHRERFEKELERAIDRNDAQGYLKDMAFLGKLFTDAEPHDGRPSKGRVKEFTAEENIAGKEWSVTYHMYVPRNYDDDGEPWPTIIGLHPSGKTGEWYMEEVLNDESMREKYVIVCPTLVEGTTWHELDGIIQLLGLVLNQVSDEYFLDRDRTFLDGYADSATSAWLLGSSFRDIFAGIVARSAAPGDAMVEGNMRYVGAFCVLGSDNENVDFDATRKMFEKLEQEKYPIVLQEKAGQGDSTFTDANPDIVAWLDGQRRHLFPSHVDIRTRERMFGRGYWVSVTKTETATDEETGLPLLARLEAVANPTDNRIDITSENVYEVELFLNDDIVDLDRPFTIYVNGEKTWNGIKERDWRYLLERYQSSGDATRLFTASMIVDIKAN